MFDHRVGLPVSLRRVTREADIRNSPVKTAVQTCPLGATTLSGFPSKASSAFPIGPLLSGTISRKMSCISQSASTWVTRGFKVTTAGFGNVIRGRYRAVVPADKCLVERRKTRPIPFQPEPAIKRKIAHFTYLGPQAVGANMPSGQRKQIPAYTCYVSYVIQVDSHVT